MGVRKLCWNTFRWEMTTDQLINYAEALGIKLSTKSGRQKEKIAKEVWAAVKETT